MANVSEFKALFEKADTAGIAAGLRAVPIPMVVEEHANPLNDASPVVRRYAPIMDGVCGFAWVTVKPATSSFARWLKANDLGRPAYGGGLMVWVGEFNQSLTRKEAYAHAFAEVLRAAGIKAYSGSRMD